MTTVNFGDLSRGMVIEVDNAPWEIMDYERHKMQQRAPVTSIKMKNLITGVVVERKFQNYQTSFSLADIETRQAQYLYTDGNYYFFLDQESFDQHELTKSLLADKLGYLKENMMVEVIFYKGNPISINLPTFVELTITETPPAYKGDTATGGNKPATLETGLRLNVPMFVTTGQRIKVDTRTGSYIERV